MPLAGLRERMMCRAAATAVILFSIPRQSPRQHRKPSLATRLARSLSGPLPPFKRRGAIADGYFGAGQSSVGKTNGTSGWPTGPAPGSARGATLSAVPGVAKREAAT